jgi:hypothetical protein
MGDSPSLMVIEAATNTAYEKWLQESEDSIIILDKATSNTGGKVALSDIGDALKEYERVFKAGLASPAEILTLNRAYPNEPKYAEVVKILELDDKEPVVVGGPASVELVDREGHLITMSALDDAFERYMNNFRARNVMVMHSDVQVGHALPAFIAKSGQIFKSGVKDNALFLICELRNDTKIGLKVADQIKDNKMRSYSIAGSATKTQNITKGTNTYMQVDQLELAEVTICEKGVNQGAHFELMKSEVVPASTPGSFFTVISKEEVPTFTEIFTAWFDKASIVPGLGAKQMAVLENENARQLQSRAISSLLGLPDEVDLERARYAPVTYSEPGNIISPVIVNESGQFLGDPNMEEMRKARDAFAAWMAKEEEGRMARSQLDRIRDIADSLYGLIEDEEDLPGWVQNKISDTLHNMEASATHLGNKDKNG